MRIFQLYAFAFLVLGYSNVLFAQGPKPEGATMKEYAESLKDYTKDQFRPALPGQELTAKTIIEELRTFVNSPTDVDPENLFDYNRGTSKQKVSDNWMADVYELAGNYKWMSEDYCSATRMVGICYRVTLEGVEFTPIWEYFVPFQRVESHDVPFTTGYWPEDDVMAGEPLFQGLSLITYNQLDPTLISKRVPDGKSPTELPGVKTMLEESDEALYDGFMPEQLRPIIQVVMSVSGDNEKMEWKERLPKNWKEVITKYLDTINPDNTVTGFDPDGTIGKGEVDRKLIDRFKATFDLQISRWRAHKDESGGFRTAEYHFSSTLFHEITKDFPGFNTLDQGSEASFTPLTWCHDGANYGCQGKAIEPIFFGEWVYNGLFARTYAMLSFLWQGLKDFTPVGLGGGIAPLNCAKKNLVPLGDTPTDMKLTAPNQGENIPQWCMAPNHNDAIGPITNYHKTNYPALASEQAFRRGLLAAKFYPQFDSRVHPTRDRNELFKRDKMMIFNTQYDNDLLIEYVRMQFGGQEPKSNHNEKFPQGCQPFDEKKQNELTADWGGAAYGAANHLNLDYDGHRHVRAHFRYIRCCPCGWIPWRWFEPPFQFQTF